MTQKRSANRNARHNKVLRGIGVVGRSPKEDTVNREVLRRQMALIKKDYKKLIHDVAKGYGLIVSWVEVETISGSQYLKSHFIKR